MFKKMISSVLVMVMVLTSCNWSNIVFAAGDTITVDMTLGEIAAVEGIRESGIYLWDDEKDSEVTLASKCQAMAQDTANNVNCMLNAYKSGIQVTHNIYSEEEIAADPTKANAKLFFTPAENPNAPFVVIAPGGAYALLSAWEEGYSTAGAFHDRGYNTFVLYYRYGDRATSAAEKNAPNVDLANAIKYIFNNANQLGVSTENYLLIGGSAGGHLVGEWATSNYGYEAHNLPAPQAIILLYPLVNFENVAGTFGNMYKILLGEDVSLQDAGAQLNLDENLSDNAPPMYVVAGGKDTLTEYDKQAQALINAMETKGLVYSGIKYEGLGHGLVADQQAQDFPTNGTLTGWLDYALDFCNNPKKAPMEIVEAETTEEVTTVEAGESGFPINMSGEVDAYYNLSWDTEVKTNLLIINEDGSFTLTGCLNFNAEALRAFAQNNKVIAGLMGMDVNALPDPMMCTLNFKWSDKIVYNKNTKKLEFAFNNPRSESATLDVLPAAGDCTGPMTESYIDIDPDTGEATFHFIQVIESGQSAGTYELFPMNIGGETALNTLTKAQTNALIKALGGGEEETTTQKEPETTTEPETGNPGDDSQAVTVPYNPVEPAKTAQNLSVKAYATPSELKNSSNFTLSDDNMEHVGKIRFGKDTDGNAMDWYIAGQDTNASSTDNVALLASKPISSAKVVYQSGNDLNTSDNFQTYMEGFGVTYAWGGKGLPSWIWQSSANHYGRSEMRTVLNGYATNASLFSATEQNMMLTNTIATHDVQNTNKPLFQSTQYNFYTTQDKLYLPQSGGADASLRIGSTSKAAGLSTDTLDAGYVGGLYINRGVGVFLQNLGGDTIWTRYPTSNTGNANLRNIKCNGTYWSGTMAIDYKAQEGHYALPAMGLDLSNVFFASAAKASTSGVTHANIKTSTGTADAAQADAMTVRLNGNISSTIERTAQVIKVTPQNGETGLSLVVQGNNGNDWYYSKAITGTGVSKVSLAQISSELGFVPDLSKCKIWLEKASGSNDSISYAKMATESQGYIVSKDGTPVNEYFPGEVYKLPNTILNGFYDGTKLYKSATPVRVYSDMNFRSITLKVDTTYGAGIKLTSTNLLENSGIRFGATITVTDLEGNSVADLLDPSKAIVTGGMLITTNDLYENNGTLTLDSDYKTINIVNQGWFNGVTGKYYGSLLGIAYGNFQRQFVAKAYISVQYEYEEQPTILYGNASQPRSVHEVATNIKKPENADYYSSLPQAHKDIVDVYAG